MDLTNSVRKLLNRPGSSARRRGSSQRLKVESIEERIAPAVFNAANGAEFVQAVLSSNTLGGSNTVNLTGTSNAFLELFQVNTPYSFSTGYASPYGASVLPMIASGNSLTVNGNDNWITTGSGGVYGSDPARHFTVAPGATLKLNRVGLYNGLADGFNGPGGGSIFSAGTLELRDTIVTLNRVYGAEADIAVAAAGSPSPSGTLGPPVGESVRTTFDAKGGGIYIGGGSALIENSLISNNWAIGAFDELVEGASQGLGGGIFVESGSITISNSTVLKNNTQGNTITNPPVGLDPPTVDSAAGQGGGIYLAGGTAQIVNTTVSGNRSRAGLDDHTDGSNGAGIYANAGTAALVNLTIADNTSVGSGSAGGLDVESGANVRISNSLIARNQAFQEADLKSAVTLSNSASNLIGVAGSNTGLSAAANILGPATAGLGSLMNPPQTLSGPRPAYALEPGSPAIDAGLADSLPADSRDHDGDGNTTEKEPYDQMRNTRVAGTAPDIGATEFVTRQPTISRDLATIVINEGDTAFQTGTADDPDGRGHLKLSATTGTVTYNAAQGTWSWSALYPDNLNGYEIVYVTVTDEFNYSSTVQFNVFVNNVAPTIDLSGADEVVEANPYSLTLGQVTDPGRDSVFWYDVNWGDGTSNRYLSNGTVSHVYPDGGFTRQIYVTLHDDDPPVTYKGPLVSILDKAPTLAGLDVGDQATPVTADVDADGDVDVVAGAADGRVRYFENLGNPVAPNLQPQAGASDPFRNIDVGENSSPAFADLDHDGDMDLFVANNTGAISYFKNTGTAIAPAFTLQTPANNPFAGVQIGAQTRITGGDLDHDGDWDLVAGIAPGILYYFKNTGSSSSPVFTQQLSSANPFLRVEVNSNAAPALEDVDHDGDLDLLIGDSDGGVAYYQNTGAAINPVFQLATGNDNPFRSMSVAGTSAPAIADIEHDEKWNVVLGRADGAFQFFQMTPVTPASYNFVLQTGTDNPVGAISASAHLAVATGDLDADGNLDLAAGDANGSVRYYRNTGTATNPKFEEQTGANNPFANVSVGSYPTMNFEDMDRDGDLDLVAGVNEALTYFRNTGTANNPQFTQIAGAFPLIPNIDLTTVAVGDLNHDGDADIVTAGQYYDSIFQQAVPLGVRVYQNQGSATAVGGWTVVGTDTSEYAGLNLSVTRSVFAGDPPPGLALGDLNQDGDLDFVFSNFVKTITVLDNRRSAVVPDFVYQSDTGDILNTRDGEYLLPTLADIDSDGDLDMIAGATEGTFSRPSSRPARIYLNNRSPVVVKSLPDQALSGDGALSFTLPGESFRDLDRDTLTYAAGLANGDPLPAWMSFDPNTLAFRGNPTARDLPQFTVRVTADDGQGGSTFSDFQVTLGGVNDLPVIDSISVPATATEGGTIAVTASAADPDGSPGALRYFWKITDAGGNSFADVGSSISLPVLDSGPYTVALAVTDGDGGTTIARRTLTSANVAPAAVLTNSGPVDEGQSVTIRFTDATDVSDYDRLAGLHFSFALTPEGLDTSYESAQAPVSFDFTPSDSGTAVVYGRVFDKDGGFQDYFTTVTVNNLPPAITTMTLPSDVNEGETLRLSATATDPAGDADVLNYVWVITSPFGLPTRLTGPEVNIPDAQAGNYSVRLTVSDEDGGSTSRTEIVRVNGKPTDLFLFGNSVRENSPAVSVVGSFASRDPNLFERFAYSLVAGEGDTDNGAFTIDNATLLANAAFDFETKSTFSIRVRTTDTGGLWLEQAFTVTVLDVNEAPVVTVRDATITGDENQPATNSGTFSDPEGRNTVTLSASVGAIVQDNAAGTWAWSHTPTDNSAPAVVTITATDGGGLSNTTTFTLNTRNLAPTASIQPPALALAGAPTAFTFRATDPSPVDQAGTFVYAIDWNGDGTVDQTVSGPSEITLSRTFAGPGNATVRATVTDKDNGAGTTASVTFLVQPVTTRDLQTLLDQQIDVTLQAPASADLQTIISAIAGLTAQNGPRTLTVKLEAGVYSGTTLAVPSNMTLTLSGEGVDAVFVGASPAITVSRGTVVLEHLSLSNSTAASTLLLTGGNLTVRNSTIQESTTSAQAAILVSGGALDLGTTGNPGGNTINVNGTGDLIRNRTGQSISALGDNFQVNGATLSSPYRIEDYIEHGIDAGGYGVVTVVPGNVFVTKKSGSVQRAVDQVVSRGTVNVESGVSRDFNAGNKLLKVAFQDGPTFSRLPDPLDSTKIALTVTGGSSSDEIEVGRQGNSGYSIQVESGREWEAAFTGAADRIVADGGEGNDEIKIQNSVDVQAWLYGGGGDDQLFSGGGNDLLFGGNGNDVLISNGGRDILVGGAGSDSLIGGSAEDLLIGGSLAFENDSSAMMKIQQEWNSGRDFPTRIANLKGSGTGPRLNGGLFVKPDGTGATVYEDGASDVLNGGNGRDWIIGKRSGRNGDSVFGLEKIDVFDDLG